VSPGDEATVPPAAAARLDALRSRDDGFFTSNLSVNEFMLVREAGFAPVSQVMGSCVYHVGWQGVPAVRTGPQLLFGATRGGYESGETFELEVPTDAWNTARGRALARLREEARRAGAAAVVGVRIERSEFSLGSGLIEFVATGTAVRSERYDLGAEPVLSNLSGQDFAKLVTIGWWPVGLVAGTTVAYVMTGWGQQRNAASLIGRMRNQELPDFSRGITTARAGALQRMEREAHALHAHGVVGVSIDQKQKEREVDYNNVSYTDLWVETHVLGTAIVELQGTAKHLDMYSAISLSEELM
jgi:uncharacterized protein YbjQ (UPF0145 family)